MKLAKFHLARAARIYKIKYTSSTNIKHDLVSFSFAMDDMDEIFHRVLDST